MELASELAAPFMPLVDRALMGIYRRQQELVWTDHQVLVTESVAAAVPGDGVAFSDLGELRLKGFSAPVHLLEARRA
jgi:hypothetical protein